MIQSISKLTSKFLLITSLLLLSSTSSAYFSHDPNGDMFIQKPFGDTSNCGPLSALMLSKFVKGTKDHSNIREAIDDARMSVQQQKKENINYRWWSFKDIKKFLNLQQVGYSEIDTKNFRYAQSRSSKIVKSIADGNVVVINIDMNDLPKNSEIGKFYGTSKLFGRWGHFLVIVGYKKVNGQLAYEIHDSYSEKGKNRLFYAKDINTAITKYNKKLLLVKKQNEVNGDIFSQYFK